MSNIKNEVALSTYQQGVIDWVDNGKGSAVVIAVAGAGKTFTIEKALPHIPEQCYVSILAFNTSIADELKNRIAKMAMETGRTYRNFRAMTFHSMGGSAVARRLGRRSARDLNTNSKKCRDLCEKLMPPPASDSDFSSGQTEYSMYADFITKLVGFAKGEGVGPLCPDTNETWWRLIRHHDLALESEDATEDRAIELARQLLALSNKEAQTGHIDFDDMLYLPLLWRLSLFRCDWVIVDEAQDTSPVRRALAKLNLKPGGRSLWVGDPKQAIYGFTGASADAIELVKTEFHAVELPLTVCYRCARAVVAKAQEIVPYIEASETRVEMVDGQPTMVPTPEGLVETLPEQDALAILDQHDAILCRNTAPLVQMAMGLIAKGRPAKVLGKDIGVGLVNLVKKMRARSLDQLEIKLSNYADREIAKFMARGEEQKAERVSDTVECVRVIAANLEEGKSRTVGGLIQKIEALFSDSNGCIILSTVHKAKGKEWKRVGILQPELMPSKWSRQDWQYEQEKHLQYVAYTRAQEHLIFMTTAPNKAKKEAAK